MRIRPGHVIVNASGAEGGVRHERKVVRETSNGKGVATDTHTHKVVDHAGVVSSTDQLVKKVDYLCRKWCAWTRFGWYTDDIGLQRIESEIPRLEEEAAVLNDVAASVGSDRRVHVGIVATDISERNKRAAQEAARTIHEVLVAIRAALQSGRVKRVVDESGEIVLDDDLHAPALKAHNLDRLIAGTAGKTIVKALHSVPGIKKKILAAIRSGTTAAGAAALAGTEADLTAIDEALALLVAVRNESSKESSKARRAGGQ